MKHRRVFELLPDYHEGTLTDEDKQSVGDHLASCAGCRQASEVIAFGFSELRREEPLEIPSHYFNNLLPRLRERMDAHQERRSRIFLPAWLDPLMAPFSAFSVVISVAGLFVLLRILPAGGDFSLQGLTAGISQDELALLANQEMTLSEPLLHQPLIETASNAALLSSQLAHELIAGEGIAESLTISPAASVEVPEVELLSEDEITHVIDHLSHTRTL